MVRFSPNRWSIKLGIGLIAVGSLGGFALQSNVGNAAAPDRFELVESAACGHAQSTPTQETGYGQTIVVTIPATVFLRVDHLGRVTAAATNTGCAPRQSDDVYLFWPDSSITQSHTFDVAAVDWIGDFTVPAEFQPQS